MPRRWLPRATGTPPEAACQRCRTGACRDFASAASSAPAAVRVAEALSWPGALLRRRVQDGEREAASAGGVARRSRTCSPCGSWRGLRLPSPSPPAERWLTDLGDDRQGARDRAQQQVAAAERRLRDADTRVAAGLHEGERRDSNPRPPGPRPGGQPQPTCQGMARPWPQFRSCLLVARRPPRVYAGAQPT
jgi:hypothetical protein